MTPIQAALAAHVAREMAQGFAEAEDTVCCPHHGPRRKSAAEALQNDVDDSEYLCSLCGRVCDDVPF